MKKKNKGYKSIAKVGTDKGYIETKGSAANIFATGISIAFAILAGFIGAALKNNIEKK